MFAVGALDDLREVSPPAKIAGHGAGRRACCRSLGVTMLFFRVPFARASSCSSPDLAPLVTVLVGRAAWPTRSTSSTGSTASPPASSPSPAGAFFLYADRLFNDGVLDGGNIAPLVAVIARRRCASASCRATSTRPGSSWATPARCCSGLLMAASTITVGGRTDHAVQRPDLLLLRAAAHPAASSSACRSSTPRSRSCAARRRRTASRDGRQGPPAPPADAPRPRPRGAASSILWAWTALLSGFVLSRPTPAGATRSCRSASPALGLLLFTVLPPRARRQRAATTGADDVATDDAGLDGRRRRSSTRRRRSFAAAREDPPRRVGSGSTGSRVRPLASRVRRSQIGMLARLRAGSVQMRQHPRSGSTRDGSSGRSASGANCNNGAAKRSPGAFELVAHARSCSALLGCWLDRRLGTAPAVHAIVFARRSGCRRHAVRALLRLHGRDGRARRRASRGRERPSPSTQPRRRGRRDVSASTWSSRGLLVAPVDRRSSRLIWRLDGALSARARPRPRRSSTSSLVGGILLVGRRASRPACSWRAALGGFLVRLAADRSSSSCWCGTPSWVDLAAARHHHRRAPTSACSFWEMRYVSLTLACPGLKPAAGSDRRPRSRS